MGNETPEQREKKAREIVDEWRFAQSGGMEQTLRFIDTEPLVTTIATALVEAGGGQVDEYRDCPMCAALKSFVISPLDPAVGYCFKEQKAWRINSLTCATVGCLRAKATFGDHCMGCLENLVNTEV